MPLKIELKPRERIIIGESLITNDSERIRFYIEGSVPILREKFILRESEADTPARRVYFIVQQLYLSRSSEQYQKLFLEYVKDLQMAAPSLAPIIGSLSMLVLEGDYYGAIKEADKLVKEEQRLFGPALKGL